MGNASALRRRRQHGRVRLRLGLCARRRRPAKFAIGSADGNRLWVNGSLKNDNNASRSLTRDQDNTGSVSLPAGWSRVLFKVHNFTGTFQGTVSLRNASNANLNEPSVNYYDLGGYYSYGLGYEQDAWYPQIVVSNIYGVSNPTNGAALLRQQHHRHCQREFPTARDRCRTGGRCSTNGAMAGQRGFELCGRVRHACRHQLVAYHHRRDRPPALPFLRRQPVGPHLLPGQRGERRLQVFQDAGNYARYYDVYVDNIPPQNPGFSSVTVASTTQINLAWTIPLDQGVNVAPGSTESAGAAGNQDSQNWYRVGDVGVQVYRERFTDLRLGNGTALNDTALRPNTAYTYTLEARDNSSAARGAWNNTTGPQGANTAWTLSVPPAPGSVTPDQPSVAYGNGHWPSIADALR